MNFKDLTFKLPQKGDFHASCTQNQCNFLTYLNQCYALIDYVSIFGFKNFGVIGVIKDFSTHPVTV